ncbi:hypothetical protein CFP56_019895 [Quercus suber]|uniref:Uncharacterized protein n=1 Tax=Quercus suber TaxID=58331 RepID=A0AAW0KK76_QUESU
MTGKTRASSPELCRSKMIPRLASRKLEQELHQIWVSRSLGKVPLWLGVPTNSLMQLFDQ